MIAVYTAIFGDKDFLLDPLNIKINNNINVDYYCFTDNLELKSNVYSIIYKNPPVNCVIRRSRFFKINGAEELKGYDYLIWHDGNIQINSDKIECLIKELGDNFMAAFKHPYRDNIFDESKVCIKRNKDNYFKILIQLLVYMWNGVNTKSKLFETGILVKNNKIKDEFHELWWEDIKKYSSRDQISLSYLIEKKQQTLSLLHGEGNNNPYSIYYPHIIKSISNKSLFHKLKVNIFELAIDFLKVVQDVFHRSTSI